MKKSYKGEIFIFISCLFFSIESIFVKFASNYHSGIFISFFKFSFGLILGILIILIWKKEILFNDKKDLLFRGLWGAASMICLYIAIKMSNSGRAILLNNTGPIFAGVFGFLFFKEKINLNIIMSLLFCIIGAILIFYDGSKSNLLGDIIALLSGITAGFAIHYIKKAGVNNSAIHIYLATCLIGILASSFSFKNITLISYYSFIFLFFLSLSIFLAQITMAYGFKFVEATKGSIIFFLKIPITLILSYIFLNEIINLKFIIGTLLIISGLFINVLKRKK
jgi:drug/metabolite transporter (DMT)-like permease